MIVRRCFISTIFVALSLLSGLHEIGGERWSRQISNSEWIPLANPRVISGQASENNIGRAPLPSGSHLSQVQSLSLPPVLQQQYQEQLLQLQKTQESIQKLLLLQQQLRAQQHLLQSQTYVPSDYTIAEDEKQGLPPSSIDNLRTVSELAQETLIPPHPSSEALPPVYPPQNFLPHRPGHVHRPNQNLHDNQELPNLPIQGQVIFPHGQNGEGLNVENPREDPHNYVTKHGSQRPGGKHLKGQSVPGLSQLPLIEGTGDEEEEVQLVYVPAETLAQRGQLKKSRVRNQYPIRQQHQQRENQGNIKQTSFSPDHRTFTKQVLQQIQKEQDEKEQFLKEERIKEFARLNEEQKALERKTRLQQEALQREQEVLRQREAEKKRKELERLEEMARQRELERIREAREKQRQEELERRRIAEIRAKEEKRREEEAKQREERQKQLDLEQAVKQQKIQDQRKEQSRPTVSSLNSQSQALREQARRQHLTESVRPKKIRGRQRQRTQYQEQSAYREITATTTPSPNQPPLSVYMDSSTSKQESVKVTDVLKILKDAKTIAVLDNVGPDAPQVFVGPTNLDPPYGYAKFDLPYLSSIDHNRVERKVDKLPFFVAPLSFDPPPGYSKIPFPAPHIGSVVVNTLSETSSEPDTPSGSEQNPNPTPLIEPNSYIDAVDQSESPGGTTPSYESSTTRSFSTDSSSPKYESTYSTDLGSKLRYKQFYDNKPTVSTSYYGEQSTSKKPKQYYEQEPKLTTQSPKVETMISYRQEISYSTTPSYDRTVIPHDSSIKEQNMAAQLALINQEIAQQRETQKYNTAEQYHSQTNAGESYDVNDVRAPVGPTQYNLPAELPAISPHLPGLVNALLDKQEGNLPVNSTPPPTTTTTTTPITTTRASSTTYRPRGRGRVVPTRSRTTSTEAPTSKGNADRTRRPYNRSKSRFSTTTEDYQESSYEPTKAKTPETTQKYSTVEHRKPISRTQKYRNRDRTISQSAALDQNQNIQVNQAGGYENYPAQIGTLDNTSPDTYSQTSGPASNLHQKEIPSPAVSDFTRENYPPTTPTQTENYPPLREVMVQHGTPLMSDDYSRSQNYPQTRPQEVRYQTTYEQNSDYEQGLEKNPVNGFNYQIESQEQLSHTIPQRAKEYPRYQGKLEDTADDTSVSPAEEHRYSPIYEVNVAQTQPDYNAGGQNQFNVEDGKIVTGTIDADSNAPPIFVPLQHSKQEDYELQIPSTETPLIEITTTTTTPAPVIIRQRVRGRLGGRTPHDSAIQTRPRGSQEEYVRFSAVNHDSARRNPTREGSRMTRVRARPPNHGSQVQTEGNEYIKIHAQQQRLIATTTPSTTTTTTTHTADEDIDYGFIRPPSFRQTSSIQTVHPADSRFQAPVTYRPSFSEHIISSDETAVESSPTQVLKNRPKYHQPVTRRPTNLKTFTTTTTTTTEAIPVATRMPDNTVYTVKPKTKSEEPKPTRIRGRIRRPAKKRTTTTTESGLEAHNELPLDENYPRITPQQLQHVTRQQALYDDNFDVSPQFVPNQNRPTHFFEETGENYPSQEFNLNFGNLPEQVSQRQEYDQTQLGSTSSRKYSHSNRANPTHSSSDIYGAESQWSTKLSKSSFQPSFASNRVVDQPKKSRDKVHSDETVPEIITAAPELSSVTVVVSSEYQKNADRTVDVDEGTVIFGRKTNVHTYTDRLNPTAMVTNSPTTIFQDKAGNDKKTTLGTRGWMGDREENSTEQMDTIDVPKPTKKFADPLAPRKNGTRRRRVRVRIRPITEDFVTAESQHFNTAMNSLIRDEYSSTRGSRYTTAQPIATSSITSTTTAAEVTQKSLLQDFLEEMLKNHEVSIPTRVTSITTEAPDWTISTPLTTPYNKDEDTTLRENYTPISATLTTNINEEHTVIVNESSTEPENGSQKVASPLQQTADQSQKEIELQRETKSERYWDKATLSQEDKVEHNDLENVGFTQRYKLPSSHPDDTEILEKVVDISEVTELPTTKEKIQKLSITEEKEHVMTLKKQKENFEVHPKNHRTKWSEVRYPSAFDKSQSALKLHPTTPIPGVVARDEGDNSVKTLSDYVKAIFDSMKSAEEEEEVAKVVEAKNEATDIVANNSKFNDVVSVNEVSLQAPEEANKKADTAESSQTDSTTESTAIEENITNSKADSQSVTEAMKENATTFRTTTIISDTTANTVIPSEETVFTEAPTTMSVTTSTRRTLNNGRTNSTETMLGKVLRTSTTTKVSHMTEICYRGRCVMTRPKMDEATR